MKRGRPSTQSKGKQVGNKKLRKQLDFSIHQDMASWLRIDAVKAVGISKSGHPTSCASIAEIITALFFHESGIKFHANKTTHFLNDRLVLSKGHAAPILYSALYRAKVITQEQLMSLRTKNSIIEGHPVPKIPYVDVATGSLGQGLSVAAGMAYSSKYFDKINNKIYCIVGDGEIAQGSIWEAIDFAKNYKLNNLITFVDVNALGQSQSTMHAHQLKIISKKFESFGWCTSIIDGHSFPDIIAALTKAQSEKQKPTAILAKTLKGKGFIEQIEGKMDWHGKNLGSHSSTVIDKLRQSIKNENIEFKTYSPEGEQPIEQSLSIKIQTNYEIGTRISTRKAYGNALLKARQSNQNVIALDGDMRNSTFSLTMMQKYPNSYIQCFIAEQNMVGVTTGLSCRRKIPFCSSFAAFFSRAADQIRIAGISSSKIKIVGSHSGCSIGQDGPSQMGLEDIAFFRTIPNILILVPSDGTSTEKAVELAGNYNDGPVFIRTSRPDVDVLYSKQQTFEIGKSKVLKSTNNDKLVIISYGVVTHQSIKSYFQFQKQNINIRIIDVISMKPIDKQGIKINIQQCQGKVIVAQDHYAQGALYQAICGFAFLNIKKIKHLCVKKIPGSAKPHEQLQISEIDSQAINAAVKCILAQ